MTTAKSRGHHLKHLPVTSAMGFGVKFHKHEFSSTQKLPLSHFFFIFCPASFLFSEPQNSQQDILRFVLF